MKSNFPKSFLYLMLLCLFLQACGGVPVKKGYYINSTLHAVRGDEVYCVNYTDRSVPIPAGEKVTVNSINNHVISFTWNGNNYSFASTEKGRNVAEKDDIFSKFFTDNDVSIMINESPDEMRDSIKKGVVKKGMTKEQVLWAVGAPAVINGTQKTYNLNTKDIADSDQWLFYYNRFNRWQVEFVEGKVAEIKGCGAFGRCN